MTPKLNTEIRGQYTHYYAAHPRYVGEGIYIGIVGPHYDKRAELIHTQRIVQFPNTVWFAADEKPFLPVPVIVDSKDVEALMTTAAEWYINEYDLFLAGQEISE